jgi:hypothetical protein
MIAARKLLPVGAVLMLGACATGRPPGPAVIVMPGSGKDFAALQQDDAICRRHVTANTGYGDLALPHTQGSNALPAGVSTGATGAGTATATGTTGGVGTAAVVPAGSGTTAANASGASTPEPPDETIPNQSGYLQCMAARGDAVRPEPTGYAETVDWYGYAYPYGAYPYGYGYPYGFYDVGFIGVFGGGFHDRGFHRTFFHDGGFHRGFFHGGGFHSGGFHGGGSHGGGSHGGGGHR